MRINFFAILFAVLFSLSLYANEQANNQLFNAIHAVDIEGVKSAIASGADINAKDYASFTPLARAIALGEKDIIDTLLKKEVSLYLLDQYGNSALQVAIAYNRIELMETLLSDYKMNPNGETNSNTLLLPLLTKGITPEAIRMLAQFGANVNAVVETTPSYSQITPHGARKDTTPDHSRWQDFSIREKTILQVYVSSGFSLESIRALIDAGADVNTKIQPGITALHLTVERQNQAPGDDVARLLLERGADPKAKAKVGRFKWHKNGTPFKESGWWIGKKTHVVEETPARRAFRHGKFALATVLTTYRPPPCY